MHGSNPVVSAPDATAVRRRLEALDLLVVCDVVPSETARIADVVLPVTQWAEEEGTMTSLEGRVLRRRRAVAAPPEVRDELAVLADLAARLGCTARFDTERPASCSPSSLGLAAGGRADYAGIDYDRLDAGEALHWPCPTPDHAGTPRLFLDAFATAERAGRDDAGAARPSGRRPAGRRPAVPGHRPAPRALPVRRADPPRPRPQPVDAAVPSSRCTRTLRGPLGAADGDLVTVTSSRARRPPRHGSAAASAPDTVFMPFHWGGEGSVNALTNDATDPVSGMPEFKVCAVSVALAPVEVPA